MTGSNFTACFFYVMKKEECFHLGYISRSIGTEGELVFTLDVDDPNRYRRLDAVFIELGGQLVPFFIESLRLRNNFATVRLEGIDTTERAMELVKAQLWLPLSALPPLKGNRFYFHEVIGFTVIDDEHGNIGTIESVLDFPQQKIFQVKKDDKEILIPVLDHILKKVDRKNRIIEVKTPEGLVELYLGTTESQEEKDEETP